MRQSPPDSPHAGHQAQTRAATVTAAHAAIAASAIAATTAAVARVAAARTTKAQARAERLAAIEARNKNAPGAAVARAGG